MPRGGERAPTPEEIEQRLRSQEAVEMRALGLTYDQIAQRLGYSSRQVCHKAVMRELKRRGNDAVDHMRSLEGTRLDMMFRPMFLKAVAGDRLATDRCIAIIRLRAEIFGLMAPQRIQQMVITEEQVLEAIERMKEETKALEAASDDEDDGPVIDAQEVA